MPYEREREFIVREMKAAYEVCMQGGVSGVKQKSQFDLVTDIDCGIEQRISDAIRRTFPNDFIHGEEMSSTERVRGRTWTVDPIDGTCNMANGIPVYGVQCALFEGGDVVVAAVYLPLFGEVITAVKGGGCYLNGRRVTVKKDGLLQNALVSFGDYPHAKIPKIANRQHAAIRRLYPQIGKIRMFGAACVDFAFVAAGRTDGTVVITRNLWDIAPGILMCREAGAILSDLNGEPYQFGAEGVVAAATPALAERIKEAFSVTVCGRKYAAVIFDFDGVIMDTEAYHFRAWNEACASFGVQLTEEEYFPLRSTGRPYIASFIEKKRGKAFTEEERLRLFSAKQAAYERGIQALSERDFLGGVLPFLKELHRAGVKTAVASSGVHAATLIERYGLSSYFDAVLGPEVDVPKKPAPDLFLAGAARLGVPAQRCLVFEDSVAGIAGAAAAGMDVIAIGGIFSEKCILCARDFRKIVEEDGEKNL